MRICHVSPHLPPDQAANALLPAELGRWSREHGIDVTFVSQPPAQGGRVTDELAGPAHRVPARSTSALARITRFDGLRRARAITRALDAAAADADVLHLHSNGLIVEVAAEWAKRRGRPFVLTLYGTEIWHYRKRWPVDPFTRAYRQAASVAFYSQGLLTRARELGLDRPGLEVVYPAVSAQFVRVDEETRQRYRSELGIREPLMILNVKRLHELAGQRYLIDAFATIARTRDDVRLVICGTGPLLSDLQSLARASIVADRITFAGLVPNDRVARYAAAADVFALPSLLEALPTVAVEALAAGTPVVSADHPGGEELRAIFGDDVAMVPRENADALATAIERRLADPRRTLPDTAAIIARRFAPEEVIGAYERLYQSALGGTQ